MSANGTKAIDKIRDEMATTKTNGAAIRAVGEIMTALLEAHPDWAGAVLKKDKTLKGAYGAMEHYAREHKEGSCYYMPPETAEGVICRYYGVGGETETAEATTKETAEAGETTAEETGETEDANYGVPTESKLPQSAALTAFRGPAGPISLKTVHRTVFRALDASEREPDEGGQRIAAPTLGSREAQTSAPADPFDLDALLGGL